jgi:RHS repeat-associated protein
MRGFACFERHALAAAWCGLLFAIAAVTAQAAVPVNARPGDVTTSLVDPGEGGGGGTTSTAVPIFFEQGVLIRSGETIQPLGPNLMGDELNEYSGSLSFRHTDLALPGNNALQVHVGRQLAAGTRQAALGTGLFGDWDLEIPRLHTVAFQSKPDWYGKTGILGAYNTNRCSQYAEPPYSTYTAGSRMVSINTNSWWSGYKLYVPGTGDQTLFKRASNYGAAPLNPIQPTDGGTYPILTKQHWQVSCLPTLERGTGEGFVALAPDGTRYQFDHKVQRAYPAMDTVRYGQVPRIEIWILPTQVTDRFGNWVRYTYGGTDGWRVTSITSSDGRSITFTYNGLGNRIGSASDGTRTWSYAYDAGGALQSVTQPDGSQWRFNLTAIEKDPFSIEDPGCTNSMGRPWDFNTYVGTITHPSGAVGSFSLKMTRHGRTNVPGNADACESPYTYNDNGIQRMNTVSRYFINYALASKVLSGPGMPAMAWSYDYGAAVGSFACAGCSDGSKTVTVTDPQSNVFRRTYGTGFGSNDGLLLTTSEGSSAVVLQTTNYSYRASNAGPYPTVVGYEAGTSDPMSGIYRPLGQRTISRQGVTFTQTVDAYDIYARPTGLARSSSLGPSRSETTSYFDQTALWLLGQLSSRTIAGVQSESTSFNQVTALPTASTKFGKLQASYVFNADGTLQSVRDGLNQATTFSSYMRGMPQNIGYADGKSMSAVVNNIGTLASVTNEAGTTWSYGYDAMGRLARKTPPAGDAVAYNPTMLSFVQVPTADVGLEANHWRQTITTGNAVTINYFDARWRKRLTTSYDAANPGATQRTQRFDYDPYNRTTFAAYPARSIASIATATPGTATSYDALGRPIQSVADSELGLLTTSIQYLGGFQKRVTDPRGYTTTTAYQVFDEPSESAIASIAAPEGLNVAISRDVFGKPLAITRSGTYAGAPVSATRSYVYDVNHQLCKTVEPEIGATIQQLDAANNVAWRATGLGLTSTSTSACDWASVPGASIVGYTYDARNRVTGTGFGDGSPSIGRSYTPDGLPLTVVANSSTWTYGYNNRRLLTSESLAYGPTYNIGRSYDANAHLSQLSYPNGAAVAYAPNALGEATEVGAYASSVSYHPNGAVAGYTLGNGIVHSLSQNTRGLPLVNRDAGIVQDQYSYDANGNIGAIADQQEGVSSRSLGYDGLDRLTVANAPGVWGAASYSYDILGNLRTSQVGSRNSIHRYGTNNLPNNLLSTVETNGVYTGYAYDPRGNVTGRGSQGYYFDLGNRMVTANTVASYTYDGWGRRISVTGSNGLYRVQVYSNAGQLLYSHSQQGLSSWLTRYIYLGGKLIAETDSSAGTSYAHTDALGSPVARSNAAGQLTSRTRYEPYGATAAGSNPGSNGFTGIGFTGHVNDAETGLVYMQQRYYDPIAGRFLSVDPIVTDANTGGHFGRYEYANSNPYRYTDPDGRRSTCSVGFGCDVVYQAEGSQSQAPQPAAAREQRQLAMGQRLGELDGGGRGGGVGSASDLMTRGPTGRLPHLTKEEAAAVGQAMRAEAIAKEVKPTLDRIAAGKSFPHRNDGSVFGNREGLLPPQPSGYYREYVHPTVGVSGPGLQRVVRGQGGEVFYTPDHYGTFIRLNP